jgi:hypothetical protein
MYRKINIRTKVSKKKTGMVKSGKTSFSPVSERIRTHVQLRISSKKGSFAR